MRTATPSGATTTGRVFQHHHHHQRRFSRPRWSRGDGTRQQQQQQLLTTTTTTTTTCARDGGGETGDGWHAVRGEEHVRHPVRRSRGESGGYREPVFERDGRSRTKDENDARLHVVLVEGGWNEHVRVYAGMENKSRIRELDEHAGETSVALSSRSVPVFAER